MYPDVGWDRPPTGWSGGLSALDAPAAVAARDSTGRILTGSSGDGPHGRAIDTSTVQYAASVTKQFTAALAARAVLDGIVEESTSVRAVLPHLPAWTDAVTLHDLVHHTAGLPTTSAIAAAASCLEHDLDNDRVVHAMTLVDEPPRPPGCEFSYSNVGYVLLAEVLRRATGTELDVLADTWLFQPLQLTSARWGGTAPTTFPERPHPPATTGDGGLWSSADDLLRWLVALNHDALGSAVTHLIGRPGRLRDGTPVSYTWGATARPHRHGTIFTHGGDWPGWTAKTVRQPSTGVAVAVMTRGADPATVTTIAMDLAEHLVCEGTLEGR